MICYAIIDTNVLVSSLLKKISIPSIIVELIGNKSIIPIVSNDVVSEYISVLCRPKFGFESSDITYILGRINSNGLYINCKKTNIDLVDETDRKFYDLYKSMELMDNVYLITGNKKHFPNEKNIVSPSEFLEIIGSK